MSGLLLWMDAYQVIDQMKRTYLYGWHVTADASGCAVYRTDGGWQACRF